MKVKPTTKIKSLKESKKTKSSTKKSNSTSLIINELDDESTDTNTKVKIQLNHLKF